ncbi:hypothetical protein HC248_00196 [Polaromonas vacuolata]|uniref:DUF2946 domain-containing protein n=1 Tax=Polaromonas vacuolata TaxID=37448 RepID=A0A6H2H5Q8_9BURK|nr:DUF2946 family protein [Polaromonas vacuolata]QJC54934.1 hypothetical protein HC248_00196 [Polaromonas vacuolata]
MDEIVKAAIAKWPNVPHCYGWLGLDARGNWYLRDDNAQAAGAFCNPLKGVDPVQKLASKGSLLEHEKLISFIQRNYECEDAGSLKGQWFFQNGPQRVYVELEATPFIWRIGSAPDFEVSSHTGQTVRAQRCVVDEHGRLYLETELGFGLVHSLDMLNAADALESGLWVPQDLLTRDLPQRFGYVRSPQALQSA